MSKPNILVITQDTTTQDEFKEILVDEFDHLVALNGIDGIAIARMTKPVAVIVDQNVPDLRAVGVCKSLLSNEKVKSIPVIVLADTASVNGELKTLSNFSGVIQRPLQIQQVKSKIQEVVDSGKAGLEGKKAEAKREGPIRVLSVDDSSVVRKLVTMILTAEGFNVTTASDGLDGINKAKEIKPDIILLDFVMPKMNGFQVCRVLQKDDHLRQIPVILVTSKGDKVGDKFVNQLGVTGYITKPFQPEELVSKIHQTLESRKAPKEMMAVQETLQAPSEVSAPVEVGVSEPVPQAAGEAAAIPQAMPGESIRQAVHQVFAQEMESKIRGMIKTEFDSMVKDLDKRLEKLVIEKMNEYIRRAKKKAE